MKIESSLCRRGSSVTTKSYSAVSYFRTAADASGLMSVPSPPSSRKAVATVPRAGHRLTVSPIPNRLSRGVLNSRRVGGTKALLLDGNVLSSQTSSSSDFVSVSKSLSEKPEPVIFCRQEMPIVPDVGTWPSPQHQGRGSCPAAPSSASEDADELKRVTF